MARFGVGYDTVDVEACTNAGIALVITPDGVRRPVAVSVITLMLALTGKLLAKDRLTREAAAGYAKRSDHMGVGLVGRTLGSLGIGNIGAEVFRLAKPFRDDSEEYIDLSRPMEMRRTRRCDSSHDRSFHRFDDLRQGEFGRRLDQEVAPLRPAHAFDQAGPFHRIQNMFKEPRWDGLPPRNGARLNRTDSSIKRQVDDDQNGVMDSLI